MRTPQLLPGQLRREFFGRTEAAVYRQFQQLEERRRRDRKEDDRLADDAEFLEVAAVLISASDAASFRIELDGYEAATVAALQKNQIELDVARDEVERLLGKAHVLPDGRRVFKTQDGLRVFDEDGVELDISTIDPEEIYDWRPRWEQFDQAVTVQQQLETERAAMVEYQVKLDAARIRLESGEMTQAEFDRLHDQLAVEMPARVADELPAQGVDSPDLVQADAIELEISEESVPPTQRFEGPLPF